MKQEHYLKKKNLNICLITGSFLPVIGGAQFAVHNLAEALEKNGHNVLVLVFSKKKREYKHTHSYKIENYGIKGYKHLYISNFITAYQILMKLRKHHIDVLHIFNVFNPGFLTKYLKKLFIKIPVLGTPLGDDLYKLPEIKDGARLNPKNNNLVNKSIGYFDKIISISETFRQLIAEIYNSDKIIDIPLGTWFKLNSTENNVVLPSEIQKVLCNNFITIISVGRNHPVKNFSFSIQAFLELKKKHQNIRYVFIGKDTSALNNLITEDENDIFFFNNQPPKIVAQIYQKSDIYLNTSLFESFGLATLDAMCAGLPCIASNVCGNKDIIKPHFGYLYESNNMDDLIKKLSVLIDDNILRKKMGEEAQKEAQKYDWEIIAKRHIELYNEMISST